MTQSTAADLLQTRVDGCTARGCKIADCNAGAFRQLATQAIHLSMQARRDAVIEDLHQHLQSQRPRYDDPYAKQCSKLRLTIGDTIVCGACYASCFGITPSILRDLKDRIRQNQYSFVDKRRNNKSNQHHTAQSFAEAEEAVDKFFIKLKETDACEIPDSVRTVNEKKPTHVLPVTLLKNMLYTRYRVDCGETGSKVSYETFINRWKSHHGEIIMGSKKTAYCDTCFKNKYRQNSLSDAEKLAWDKHLTAARTWREQYRSDMQRAREGEIDMFCVDKAESLRAPRKASEQPGADYFKSGLRITINGVFDAAANKTRVHVMNESQTIGKNGGGDADSDFVLSCLWDVISGKTLRDEVVIQADNCTAQNKNNYVLKFAAFLVEMGYCKKVSVNFMIVGHTKFVVDGCFGAIKKKMIACNLYSEEDIIQQFPDSDELKPTMHIHAEHAPKWYGWRNFMQQKFGPKPLPGILSYQQFVVQKEPVNNEGKVVITARVLPTDEGVQFRSLESKCKDRMPNEIGSAGIDAKRRAELQTFFPMYSGTPFRLVFNNLKSC